MSDSNRARRGVFPGSFNPLTIAHLEIARQAHRAHDLEEVHLVVSAVALDKAEPPGPPLAERIQLIEADIAPWPWLSVRITDKQLVADIAEGYDVVVMGADKWQQLHEEKYYGSIELRDDALASLPTVAVARRTGSEVDAGVVLETDPKFWGVSSSAARAGDRSLMAPEAAATWTDDHREVDP